MSLLFRNRIIGPRKTGASSASKIKFQNPKPQNRAALNNKTEPNLSSNDRSAPFPRWFRETRRVTEARPPNSSRFRVPMERPRRADGQTELKGPSVVQIPRKGTAIDPITPLPRRSVHSLRPKIAARSSREQKRAYPRDYLARNNPSGRCLSYYSSRCHGMLATDSGSANMPAERQRSFANVSTTSDESRDRLHLANLAIGVCVKGIGRFGDFHAEIAGCCLRQKKLF